MSTTSGTMLNTHLALLLLCVGAVESMHVYGDAGWAVWLAALAFSAGLLSSAHCAVMCGPLLLARRLSSHGDVARTLGGRVVSYTLLGAVAGQVGSFFLSRLTLPVGIGVLVLMLGFSVHSYRRVRDKSLIRIRVKHPSLFIRARSLLRSPWIFGGAAAVLPCGALYSALLAASGAGAWWLGAISMASFAGASSLGLVFVHSGMLRPLALRFPQSYFVLAVVLPLLAWSRALWLLHEGVACHA